MQFVVLSTVMQSSLLLIYKEEFFCLQYYERPLGYLVLKGWAASPYPRLKDAPIGKKHPPLSKLSDVPQQLKLTFIIECELLTNIY